MQTLSSPPLLTLPDSIPTWIAGKPAKIILGLVTSACEAAGITGPAQFRFLTDPKGLTRRVLPHSITLNLTASYNRPNLIAFVACAKDATHHRVHCTLSLPPDQRETFVRFIQSHDHGTYVQSTTFRNPVLPPNLPSSVPEVPMSPSAPAAVPPAPAAPEFDDDALAIYLSSLQELGGTFTKSTANAIARRSTASTEIFDAALLANLIGYGAPGILLLTPKGHALLKRLAPADDATKPSPSESGPSDFDRLKAAVIEARRQHQAAKTQHDARAQSLTTLTHQLNEAREALKSEELHITTLNSRLQKVQQDLASAQSKASTARSHVLALEDQARSLDTSSPDLIQAERTLQEAEAAYQQLIAL